MTVNSEVAPAAARRALLSSFMGSVVEWYGFLLYGTASALVFDDLFFPNAGPTVATLAILATFAVGEVSRPIGGVLFGHFGDRIGRRSVLMATMLLMGLGTFAIGLLPTYDEIGMWAPVLLAVLRFVQGLAVGGEWGGAALMAVEHAPSRRRGLWGSVSQLGSASGLLLSTPVFALFAALPEGQFHAWGWRVPFLLAIVLGGIGLFVRARTLETPVFAAERRPDGGRDRAPIVEVLRTGRGRLLAAIGLAVGPLGAQMITVVWVVSYAADRGYSNSVTLGALIMISVVQLAVQPLFGLVTDSVGRRPVYAVGALLLAVNGFVLLWLVNTGSVTLFLLAFLIATLIFCTMFGQAAALLAELFPTGVRYTGMSLAYQTASVLGSGFGPLIAAALLAAAGGGANTWLVSLFIAVICMVSAACVLAVPETRGRSLTGVDLAAPGDQGGGAGGDADGHRVNGGPEEAAAKAAAAWEPEVVALRAHLAQERHDDVVPIFGVEPFDRRMEDKR
ncbi:MFS transporter [Actinomadura rubrisoli]|uniref:MFS transporter n=1 Tax=Actinomadura rubrisoli TaxID=2530368 RepID=A0A4R5CAF4_9ACTN|nr:MFS transporter [Actinomadura rubrisoli]TDD96305.1 MFS transporter [Actinomadura rubrisoli]